MNEDYINKILELAKEGIKKSEIIGLRYSYDVSAKDVNKHIVEAKKRGMYSCPIPNLLGDIYYQHE